MTSRPRRLMTLAAAGLLALLTLSACGDDAQPTDTSTVVSEPSEDPSDEPTAEPTADVSDETTETAETAGTGDICALVTEEEVAGVLGAPGVVAVEYNYGSLNDEFIGGQCVYTDDSSGDPFASGAGSFEIVVYPQGSQNPPPDQAPEVGSDEVVSDETGSYFATADKVVWLRLAGAKAEDPTALAAAADLVAAIKSRI